MGRLYERRSRQYNQLDVANNMIEHAIAIAKRHVCQIDELIELVDRNTGKIIDGLHNGLHNGRTRDGKN